MLRICVRYRLGCNASATSVAGCALDDLANDFRQLCSDCITLHCGIF